MRGSRDECGRPRHRARAAGGASVVTLSKSCPWPSATAHHFVGRERAQKAEHALERDGTELRLAVIDPPREQEARGAAGAALHRHPPTPETNCTLSQSCRSCAEARQSSAVVASGAHGASGASR